VLLIFTALWALETGEQKSWDARWIAFGAAAALGAYFTRSAGLPLLVAVLGWLALRRRFRTLGAVGAAFALPVVLWWLRGRSAGVGDYADEFWLVDPYQPGLGTVGIGGLAARAMENGVGYVTRHVPAAVVGSQSAWLTVLGVGLVGAAVYGWVVEGRRKVGVAELFVPLYVGLILVWPEVWGGDRFVLPVLPLLFLYGPSRWSGGPPGWGVGRASSRPAPSSCCCSPRWEAGWGRPGKRAPAGPRSNPAVRSRVTARASPSSWERRVGWGGRFRKGRSS
jgi:hypothetical protein